MSWRDVPMPPRVAALPKDRRGFPTPWVSCWDSATNEFPALIAQRLIRLGDTGGREVLGLQCPVVACDHVADEGVPDLGNLCPGNQIKGMLDLLCDVCGDPLDDVKYFMGSYSMKGGKVGFRECGLHYDCALYAGQVCPALVTGARHDTDTERTAIFECREYHLQPEFMARIGDEIRHLRFVSFHEAVPYVLAGKSMVLTGVYADPIDPIVTPLSEWVSLQLNGSHV